MDIIWNAPVKDPDQWFHQHRPFELGNINIRNQDSEIAASEFQQRPDKWVVRGAPIAASG
jgi:hypothetical protein